MISQIELDFSQINFKNAQVNILFSQINEGNGGGGGTGRAQRWSISTKIS